MCKSFKFCKVFRIHIENFNISKEVFKMCSMSVLCPLCARTSFTSIDALRNSLIKAANGPLSCPICNELFLGLDKLTIHLFSHTNLMTQTSNNEPKNINSKEITSTTLRYPQVQNKKTDLKVTSGDQITNFEKKSKKLKQLKGVKNNNNQQNTHNNQYLPMITDKGQQMITKNCVETKNQELVDSPYLPTCDICEFTFRTQQLRDMHFRLVHQNSPKPINSNNASNISTSITSIEPDFKCHLCAKTFKMKGSLRVHLKVVHMMGLTYVNNSSNLGICDRIRHKETNVHQNLKSNNSKVIQQSSINTSMPTTQSSIQSISPNFHLADTVLDNSESNNEISLLNTRESEPSNLVGPETLTTDANKEALQTSKCSNENPKIWECDVCSKAFTTKYFLKKHKRLHTGEMPYTCEICARTFTFQQSYHKHLLYHSDEKPHICATCGRAFKELSTLHNHERIHSGEKPFKCDICGKSFRQRVSFLVHTRIHTGVMPYKCDHCQKSFRYKVSLRTHKCVPPTSQQDILNIPLSTANLNNTSNEHLTENFIKTFLESTIASNTNTQNAMAPQNSPASLEITAINSLSCEENGTSDQNGVEAMLLKTIDDIVEESCNKLGIGNDIDNSEKILRLQSSSEVLEINNYGIHDLKESSSSPLQKLQDMRLYSPKFDMELDGCGNSCGLSQLLENSHRNGSL